MMGRKGGKLFTEINKKNYDKSSKFFQKSISFFILKKALEFQVPFEYDIKYNYLGGLHLLHGVKPIFFAASSVVSISLFFKY